MQRFIIAALILLAGSMPAQAQEVRLIDGDIDDGSSGVIRSADGIQINGMVDASNPSLMSGGFVHIRGKIDDKSNVTVNAKREMVLGDKVDGQSTLIVQAASYVVIGGDIRGQSHVNITTDGAVTLLRSILSGSSVNIVTTGTVSILGKVERGAQLTVVANSPIAINEIDGGDTAVLWCGPSLALAQKPKATTLVHKMNGCKFP